MGIVETAGQTFLLLIAVRVFAAGPTAKALLASGVSLGLALSLFLVVLATRRQWAPSRTAAVVSFAGAAGYLVGGLATPAWLFVAGNVAALALSTMLIPLLTQVYQDNYPAASRGRRFSRTVMLRVGASALFSEVAGRLLAAQMGYWRGMMIGYALALAFAAWCLWRIPSRPLAATGVPHPFAAMRFLKTDRLFRLTIISWMFMGFANLMMVPMRVEYLANERYGLTLTASRIALLVGVVPNVARLLMSPVWGAVFDRMNFFALRVTLNIGFALGILAFFTSASLPGLLLGAVIFGVSTAGADVAWSLWVTKFAPPERVADYMSVHTFFTGLRGLVAPLVAFHVVAGLPIAALGVISASLIVVATLLLVREVRFDRAPDPVRVLMTEANR
jgi:hypothetical protein